MLTPGEALQRGFDVAPPPAVEETTAETRAEVAQRRYGVRLGDYGLLLPNGTICRVLEMKPGIEIPVDTPSEVILQFAKGAFQNMQSDFEPTLESVQRHPTFHKTDSLDYLVVLSGRLTMLMDDDAEVTLEPGNVVVQQGVMHGWRVEGDEPVRVFAVLVSGATATLP